MADLVATRARSGSSSTIPWRGESRATRRWASGEARARALAGPEFVFPSPDGAVLDELTRGYERITGVQIRSAKKRKYLAACYRVHGDCLLLLAARVFAESGTETNLLGILREMAPEAIAETSPPPAASTPAPATDRPADDDLVSAPVDDTADRPTFDPASWQHSDRHHSKPEVEGFFSDDDLGLHPDRPAVRALTR